MSLVPTIGPLAQTYQKPASAPDQAAAKPDSRPADQKTAAAEVPAKAVTQTGGVRETGPAMRGETPIEPAQTPATLGSPSVLGLAEKPIDSVSAAETTRAMLPELWPDDARSRMQADAQANLSRVVDGMSDIYQTISVDTPDEFAVPWIDNLPDKL